MNGFARRLLFFSEITETAVITWSRMVFMFENIFAVHVLAGDEISSLNETASNVLNLYCSFSAY